MAEVIRIGGVNGHRIGIERISQLVRKVDGAPFDQEQAEDGPFQEVYVRQDTARMCVIAKAGCDEDKALTDLLPGAEIFVRDATFTGKCLIVQHDVQSYGASATQHDFELRILELGEPKE